jgi:hypothetical protein
MRGVVHLIAIVGLASCGGQVAAGSGKPKLDQDSSTPTESDSGVDSGVQFDGGDDSGNGLDSDTDSGSEFESGADSSDEPEDATGPCPGSVLVCCALPQGSGFQCEEDFGPASCSGKCLHGGSPASKCSALVCVDLPADGGSD